MGELSGRCPTVVVFEIEKQKEKRETGLSLFLFGPWKWKSVDKNSDEMLSLDLVFPYNKVFLAFLPVFSSTMRTIAQSWYSSCSFVNSAPRCFFSPTTDARVIPMNAGSPSMYSSSQRFSQQHQPLDCKYRRQLTLGRTETWPPWSTHNNHHQSIVIFMNGKTKHQSNQRFINLLHEG